MIEPEYDRLAVFRKHPRPLIELVAEGYPIYPCTPSIGGIHLYGRVMRKLYIDAFEGPGKGHVFNAFQRRHAPTRPVDVDPYGNAGAVVLKVAGPGVLITGVDD